jgi:predicted DCC family thiol-disulfide oxidoreductase YuxK
MSQGSLHPDYIFYDGHCGLCHGAVRFALRRDRSGIAFRFAPLQGDTFAALVDPAVRAALPDSIVVLTADGALLNRSEAILRILDRIGGGWRALGKIFRIIPPALRDAVYNLVASVRYRIFGRRDELCPVMSPDERQRFDP